MEGGCRSLSRRPLNPFARLCGNLSIPPSRKIYNWQIRFFGKKYMILSDCLPRLSRKLFILIAMSNMLMARGPEPGQSLPPFSLPDQSGAVQTFNTLKGPNGLMLVFYRSADW